MEKKLKQSLLKTCKTSDQETELRQSFVAAVPLRHALTQVLEGKSHAKHNASLADDSFELASWAHKQAYNNGYQQAIKEILSLLQ